MSDNDVLKDPDGKPLDPQAQALVNRVRRMSMISGIATVLGICVVIVMIGYRLSRSDGSTPAASEVVSMLPKGAKIVTTQVAGERVIVTIEINGAMEIRTYDSRTLQPAGRLRFATEP